jgi:hypothetical protein
MAAVIPEKTEGDNSAMIRFLRITAAVLALQAFALPGFAGQLDDRYIAAFGSRIGNSLAKALLSPVAEPGEPAGCGTPLKHALHRDWNRLEPATQKTLAKQLAAPALAAEATLLSSGGHFLIHYATSGSDAPTPGSGYTVGSWVQAVAATFEYVYSYYQTTAGYRLPPNTPYNVYLKNLAPQLVYGQTTAATATPSSGFPYAYGSFIEIDKDFASAIYAKGYTPLQILQITAAHEFHHAIQYGYNYYFDIWYAEATSVTFEDEVYNDVNQLYNYLSAWLYNTRTSLDIPLETDALRSGAGYSRWIFNRYLIERYGLNIIRSFWEKLAAVSPVNGNDIPMTPILDSVLTASFGGSLSDSFSGFARRSYTRDWISHTGDVSLIPFVYASSHDSYPYSFTSQSPGAALPHYAFSYHSFIPSANAPANLNITISNTSGISKTVFRKASGTITEISPNADGSTFVIPNFNTLNPVKDEVVLLLANSTNVDNHVATFSTGGSVSPVTEPSTTTTTTAPATTAPVSTSGSDSSSKGGGCFIATAAYGSYLHPDVQALRDFRDSRLLTNAPGRAFVEFYYRVSPPVAGFIAGHEILRICVRLLLTPVVLAVAHPLLMAGLLLSSVCAMLAVRRHRAQVVA